MKHLNQLPDGRFGEQETETLFSHYGIILPDGQGAEFYNWLIDEKETFMEQERQRETKTKERSSRGH